MLLEDDNPAIGKTKPKNLDPMSVAELKDYIVALEDEIKRAEAEIAKKSSSRAAAEAFFKS